MSDSIIGLIMVSLWIYAVVYDAQNTIVGWLLVDILLPPLGIVRAIYLLFFT